jgi:hypothetical protein
VREEGIMAVKPANPASTAAANLAADIELIAADSVSPLEVRFSALLDALEGHFAMYDRMSNPGDPFRATAFRSALQALRTDVPKPAANARLEA